GIGLERFTANGAVDTTFANGGASFIDQLNGSPMTSDSGTVASWNNLALDSTERIYLAGQINTNPASSTRLDFLVVRSTSDQSPSGATTSSPSATDAALLMMYSDDSTTMKKRK